MKPIAVSVFIGVIVALAVIYILQPLNAGAVALVVVLSVGGVAAVGALFRNPPKPRSDE